MPISPLPSIASVPGSGTATTSLMMSWPRLVIVAVAPADNVPPAVIVHEYGSDVTHAPVSGPVAYESVPVLVKLVDAN